MNEGIPNQEQRDREIMGLVDNLAINTGMMVEVEVVGENGEKSIVVVNNILGDLMTYVELYDEGDPDVVAIIEETVDELGIPEGELVGFIRRKAEEIFGKE